MLIRNAEIYGKRRHQDLRIRDDRIEAIGALTPEPEEDIFDAAGGALIPGLHDHHIHLLSYAASLNSVHCGPPNVQDEAELVDALTADSGTGWLRGYGYHESVAGEIDRWWLDEHLSNRPARIQHRSGRLWILNSLALEQLAQRGNQHPPLSLPENGRFYDADATLGTVLGRQLPPVAEASRRLASYGVTGLTDMTPGNDEQTLGLFSELKKTGLLKQHLVLAGSPELPFPHAASDITTAATKIHLHDSALPEFETLCQTIRISHENDRPVAVHCVTEVELVFTLAALEAAGTFAGDRIEHASVTPPQLLEQLAALNLTVVTQPNFISERGDAYLREVPADTHPWLYRGRAFRDHEIPLAGGTDAPFGLADPWLAMAAAVQRRTADGLILGRDEALTPEEALALFLGDPAHPARPRQIHPGATADLCLLDRPWHQARAALSRSLIKATFRAGTAIYRAPTLAR